MITVFGENCFSKSSNDLYYKIIGDDFVKKQLDIMNNHSVLTRYHAKGVAHLIAEFAVSNIINLDPSQKESLVHVATLHDLGKLSIEKSILDKPDQLDNDEWLQIKKHPVDGFHRYCFGFDNHEALPILLHHTLQLNDYPSITQQEEAISLHGLSYKELNQEDTLVNTVMLAVADNIEARYPISDPTIENAHNYNRRQYTVDDLPLLVKSSFVEAGKIRRLKLDGLLDKLIECSQEILLKK